MSDSWNQATDSQKAVDARRARRERVKAQRANAPAPPPQPELGDEVDGTALDLRPGDVLLGWGGTTPTRTFKRNKIDGWTVERTSRKPRARTRMQLHFTNERAFTLRFDYPVRYRRPAD